MEESVYLDHDEAIGIAKCLMAAVAVIEGAPTPDVLIDALRDWAIELIDRAHGINTDPEEGDTGSD